MLPNVPFMGSVMSLIFIVPASMLGNTATLFVLQKVFLEYLVSFWHNGFFGYPNLGKLYVFVYILGSIAITKWFRLFADDTYSRSLLTLAVKLSGIVLLLHGSNSIELCIGYIIIVFVYQYLAYNCPSWYVHIVGYMQTPSYKYSGKRISIEQYESEGKYYTEKALKELQQQLNKDMKYTNHVSDNLYRDGKHLQSNMLKRFAYGDYNGMPSVMKSDSKYRRY